MAQNENNHEQDDDTFGIALGFRIIEEEGSLFLAEAEIAPYVDSPDELGVTLVFHPLKGVNPVEANDDVDWPSWPIDIDDDLTRNSEHPMDKQFAAVVRQLHDLTADQLRSYMKIAREEAEEE